MSTLISGIAASNGIAIAKAYRLTEPDLSIVKRSIEDVGAEISRFKEAIQKSINELEIIRDKAETESRGR